MAKKTYEICEIVGDGIGPEIMSAAKEVLKTVQDSLGFKLRYHLAPCGDKVKEETGTTIPEESVEIFRRCDAALKGPIGDNVRDFVVGYIISIDKSSSLEAGHKLGGNKRELRRIVQVN